MSTESQGFHVLFLRELKRTPWWALSLAVHLVLLAALQHVAVPRSAAPPPGWISVRVDDAGPAAGGPIEWDPEIGEVQPVECAEAVIEDPVVREGFPDLAEIGAGTGHFPPPPLFDGTGTNRAMGIGGGAGGAWGGRGGRGGPREILVVESVPDSDAPPVWRGVRVTEGTIFCVDAADRVVDRFPLRRTDFDAEVSGLLASVRVRQHFENPLAEKVHAVYVFPLPRTAAVSEFEIEVGGRRILGVVRPRAEARRIYEEAKAAGYLASLLTQERPNLFVEEVANLEPERPVDVRIRYFHHLRMEDDWHELVMPTVVGPRFHPPGAPNPPPAPVLLPGYRLGHELGIRVSLDAGVPIEAIECRTHDVDVERDGDRRAVVTLADRFSVPDRDFVLRFRLSGEAPEAAVLAHRGRDGGFFSLVLAPPAGRREDRVPREMVFVLDGSGSMSGEPLEKSKAVVARFLSALRPYDTFRLIRFSASADELDARPLLSTPENVRRARRYLEGMSSGGGTMMMRGVEAALAPECDRDRDRYVCFLTDGYIGNEDQVFAAVRRLRKTARLFSFGVGSGVNRHLLDGLAAEGHGVAQYVLPADTAEEAATTFFRRVARPMIEDVEIDWGGIPVRDVHPRRPPDLFPGVPVMLTGRYDGGRETTVTLRGRLGGHAIRQEFRVTFPDWEDGNEVLGAIWARNRIADLLRQESSEVTPAIRDEITRIALDFHLVTPFTSFVAVDDSGRTPGAGRTIRVPVCMPEGVTYSGVFGSRGDWFELRMLGLKMEATKRGLLVREVERHGPAWLAGVERGDLVRSLNGESVRDGRAAAAAARRETDRIRMEVRREGESVTAIFFRQE